MFSGVSISAGKPLAPWRRASGIYGVALLLPLVLMVLGAALVSHAHPDSAALQPPSLSHPFGTDDLGRDMLIEVVHGMGPSLLVGLIATMTALVIGVLAGLVAASGKPLVDDIIMRALELTSTIPPLLLAIVLGALFGGNLVLIGLVLGFSFWPMVARVTRAAGFALRGQPFVLAAIALGRGSGAIAWHHLLPSVLPLALATSGVIFGGAVLAEATLSFVGLGDPSVTSWGRIIANAGSFMHVSWWLWLFPGLALVLTCVSVGLLTDTS